MSGLAPVIVAALLWVAGVVVLRRARRWLLFYLTGAFGLILLVTFGAPRVGAVSWLESVEAGHAEALAGLLGVELDILGGAGLAIPNHKGWAVFDVGIECSALLEMSAIAGLIAFYPGFSARRRVLAAGLGVAATYGFNLIRILIIVLFVRHLGTGWVFAAHAVFGRFFFFAATVGLYSYLVTRPTVAIVRSRLGAVAGG